MINNNTPPENPWSPSKPTARDSQRKTPPQNNPFAPQQNRGSGGGRFGGENELPPLFNNKMNPFSGNTSPTKAFLMTGVVLLAVWMGSGIYRVLPEENGVVLRFGRYTHTVTDPGLHYHLPKPIEMIIKPNVTFERRLELGYRGSPIPGALKQDIPDESMMLTGDANIVDLDFVVQWKVGDARQFLFNVRDPEGTLKRVAESAMREVVGQNQLQDIITDRREDISVRVKTIMQDILKSYAAGIIITQVLIQDATVPPPVLDAFEDVIRANQQAETMRNNALKYRNEIVPRAQGDAIRLIKEAEAYKESVVAEAKGDAERFNDTYNAYAQSKDVTRERLFIDAWQDILENSNSVILDNKNGGALPLVNLNELRNSGITASGTTKGDKK